MPDNLYQRIPKSVAGVLDRPEFTGCTVNFITYSKSHKLERQLSNAPENMCIFPDTQAAIINKKVFKRVPGFGQTTAALPRKSSSKACLPFCYTAPTAAVNCNLQWTRTWYRCGTVSAAQDTKAIQGIVPCILSARKCRNTLCYSRFSM